MTTLVSKQDGFECWEGGSDALLWMSAVSDLEQKETALTKAAPGKMKGREKVSIPEATKEPDCTDAPTDFSKGAAMDAWKVTVKVNINVACPSTFELGDNEDFPYVKYIYVKDSKDAIIAIHKFRPMDQGNSCELLIDSAAATSITPYAYNNLYGIWKGDPLDL
eukprot:CAMPEP_0168441142 /NCGR_PEP_ID=MMETSP0228-20121227/43336_1 /TAXON_ID=133427 /ORGANISM="Protoceratium reticulatum, Strain CCCM 535 (=CCMP 1889)" /LENGTH=163 /DNA_ID=CAMNT_0008455455 /DNA_START=85 /DNA_END=576 /DNA_ORIENTATION=+